MGNSIVVEMSAHDAEMVAAWQRARDNLEAFDEQLKKAHGHSKSFTDEMKEGFHEVGRSMLGNLVSFEAIKTGGEFLVECYRDQVKELHEVVAAQRASREELTHLLAMSGKSKEAPAVEKAFEEIHTAKKEEKLAAYRSVSEAAPELGTEKQIALVKEIAPLAELLGTQGASEVGKVAGTLSKVAPGKSAAELANLAHMAVSHSGGKGAELGEDGSLRALQILQKKLGMSTEEGLAFESEAMSKGLGSKDVEKIATSLDKQEDLHKLAHEMKTPEGRAKYQFFREYDAHKRLEMLYHDESARRAVLGDRESERFGMMSEGGVAARAEEYRQGEAGFGAQKLKEHEGHDAVAHDLRKTEIEIEEQKEGYGRKSHEELYELGEKKEELKMRREGRSEAYIKAVQDKERLARDPVGAPAPGATQALEKEQNEHLTRERAIQELERQKSLPGADVEGLQQSINRNKLLNDPEELDRQFQASRKRHADGAAAGGGAPPPHAEQHASMMGELRQQTQLLQQLLVKPHPEPHQVAVNVHTGGSRGPRINDVGRAEAMPSMALSMGHGGHGTKGEDGALST